MRKILYVVVIISFICLNGYSQVRGTNYRSSVLDSFNDPDGDIQWIVRSSKYTMDEFPKAGYIKNWPTALHGWDDNGRGLKVLGIEAMFNRRGYNYVEVIPATKDERGNIIPQNIDLPRNVQSLDLWAWGSNNSYYLEVMLRDFRGIVHTIPMGDLSYHGWRNLSVILPRNIPRRDPNSLTKSGLEIEKILLWTRPEASNNHVFVYFDDLNVVARGVEPVRDGGNLFDDDLRDRLWEDAEGGE